jgi:hypothetical protein
VDDCWPFSSEKSPKPAIDAEVLPGALVEIDDIHIFSNKAVTELCVVREADDYMAITLGRHMVNQVDQAILQTTNRQTVNYMHHERIDLVRSVLLSVSHPELPVRFQRIVLFEKCFT